MRSSKSRSRGKSNRRSVGNIVNRVFDSSGPEGKVRGTPQQIIDKYQMLARDAALANDRVAAENFQQHAEHYTRLLGDAQREQEARRESQEAQQQQNRRERNTNGDGRDTSPGSGDQPQSDLASDVVDLGDDGDSGLVETPESSAKKPRSRRRKTANPDGGGDGDGDSPPETKAAE